MMTGQMSLEDILGDVDYRAKSTADKFLKNTRGDFMGNIYLREVPTQEDYDKALAIGLIKRNVNTRLRDGWTLKRMGLVAEMHIKDFMYITCHLKKRLQNQ